MSALYGIVKANLERGINGKTATISVGPILREKFQFSFRIGQFPFLIDYKIWALLAKFG